MPDCLLLNSDESPVSMLPLSAISWKEAIRYMVQDKVNVLEWYDEWVVRSVRWETKVPAVIMLKEFSKKKTGVRFSKMNVFLRDEFTCQYCFTSVNKASATLDHVLPISMGGKTEWTNSTTACYPCNGAKGNNARIKPAKSPYKPSYWELVEKRKKLNFEFRHPSWHLFLD
jgi:5-methylcytosine-specific restriction endonuclease McrA